MSWLEYLEKSGNVGFSVPQKRAHRSKHCTMGAWKSDRCVIVRKFKCCQSAVLRYYRSQHVQQ